MRNLLVICACAATALVASPSAHARTCAATDGARVTGGDSTSCAFAGQVARAWVIAYERNPRGTIEVTVYSPTTRRSYRMTCKATRYSDHITARCTGGNHAYVALRLAS